MTILMYTIGVVVASLLTIFMVYKFMKRVNRAEFVSLLIFSLFSWGMVLVLAIVLVRDGMSFYLCFLFRFGYSDGKDCFECRCN